MLEDESADEDEVGEDGDEDDDDDGADEGSEDDSAEEGEEGEDADEDDDEDGEEGSESEGDDESGDEDDNGSSGAADDSKESTGAPGYYIPYSLKVEGLKQTALKDALKKFASDLFDKVGFKIKGSGLFGSGGEIDVSVKKIKDAIKGVFGAIDPKKLKDGVRKEIGNKVEDPSIDILEKTDIYKKYEKSLNPQAKAQISKAEYSLVISGKEKVPEKPTFNKRNIADIVQSSIAGLFKKFKNKITKNDVILIQVADGGVDDAVAKMSKKLLKVADLEKLLDGNHTYEEIVKKLKDALDPLAKDKTLPKNPLANGCVKAWQKFYDKHKDDKRLAKGYAGKDGKGHDDAKTMQQYFSSFVEAYKKQFKENKMYVKALSESAVDRLLNIMPRLRSIVLESLFSEADDEEEDFDDEDDADEDGAEFDAAAAKKTAEEVFANELQGFSCAVNAGNKAELKSALAKYDVS